MTPHDSKNTTGRWTFRNRKSGYEQRADLWLYPELDYSAVVADFDDRGAWGQLEGYVNHLKTHRPQWLEDDAVPIVWTVRGHGVFESAPFQAGREDRENFLTHFTWPMDEERGEFLDWFTMPVVNDRFPEFAKALRWTPSPLEPVCRLSSILKSRLADET